MTRKTPGEKKFLNVRIDAEDWHYIKKFFHVQGYNAGVRWLIHTFVKMCKEKEAQNAPGKFDTKLPPDAAAVLRQIGLDDTGGEARGSDGEGPSVNKG